MSEPQNYKSVSRRSQIFQFLLLEHYRLEIAYELYAPLSPLALPEKLHLTCLLWRVTLMLA